jgi:hypothetical protein
VHCDEQAHSHSERREAAINRNASSGHTMRSVPLEGGFGNALTLIDGEARKPR